MKKKSMLDLHRVDAEQYKEVEKIPLVVVLDNVRSEMNVGSVFRTGDAFVIEGVVLCGITSQPPRPEIHKTALGAEESVQWKYYKETLDAVNYLRGEGYKILSIEQVHGSTSLEKFITKPGEKYAVIFGNEVKGGQQAVVDASDGSIEIPQLGTKHSLNIANTAAIVMWHVFQQCKL
ncbi:MAG: TrmH family RNA methyltransferase [Bacteroidales bacterium]|nr:TrmH family RNA methyltransferase [Candidatus Sodaliphilus limicaballi]